jgi:hypothetical protein
MLLVLAGARIARFARAQIPLPRNLSIEERRALAGEMGRWTISNDERVRSPLPVSH